jgi:hypothetical protein
VDGAELGFVKAVEPIRPCASRLQTCAPGTVIECKPERTECDQRVQKAQKKKSDGASESLKRISGPSAGVSPG